VEALPTPSFLKKFFRKVADAEGRVLDTFECGSMNVMESLRLRQELGWGKDLDSFTIPLRGGRSKVFPTRPSALGPGNENASGDCPTG
jgi:hypothetical protein